MSEAEPIVLPAEQPKPRKGERAAKIRQLALRHPELSQADIAKKVGCKPQNVSGVLATFLADKKYDELQEFRENKTEIFEAVQYNALASITSDHLRNASFQQLVTGAAILQDKIQLMSGLPTSIHVTALVDVLEQLRKRDDDKR